MNCRSSERNQPPTEAERTPATDWTFGLFFASELRRQWAPRHRRIAGFALFALFAVQFVVELLLMRFSASVATDPIRHFPPLAWKLISPLMSPLPYALPNSPAHPYPLIVVVQIAAWVASTVLLFLGPAFAARSLAPDRESGRLRDLVLAGVSPHVILGAKSLAAMAPLAGVLLATTLLSAGLLAGAHLAGKPELLGSVAGMPPAIPAPTQPDPITRQALNVAVSVTEWLCLAAVLSAFGATARTTRAALFWCFAVALLFHPLAEFGMSFVVRAGSSGLGDYRFLRAAAVGVIQLLGAAILYRRALRDLEQPDENEPWVEVRRPAIWDLTLSDEPDEELPSANPTQVR